MSTRHAVVGGGHRAHHLVTQVYAVRDREYRYAAEDGWSIVGEATRPATPTDAKKAAALAVGAQQSIEHGPFYRIDDDYDVQPE